jgi:hypothetical protein
MPPHSLSGVTFSDISARAAHGAGVAAEERELGGGIALHHAELARLGLGQAFATILSDAACMHMQPK